MQDKTGRHHPQKTGDIALGCCSDVALKVNREQGEGWQQREAGQDIPVVPIIAGNGLVIAHRSPVGRRFFLHFQDILKKSLTQNILYGKKTSVNPNLDIGSACGNLKGKFGN